MALKKRKTHKTSKKVQRIINKKTKSMKKRMRKQLFNKKTLRKDPGIPNLYPFKKELLQKIIKNKNTLEAQKLLKRKEKKLSAVETNEEKEHRAEIEEEAKADITVKERIPPKNKKYSLLLDKVVEESDVVLFVLDARDPNGCRDRKLEALIRSKQSNTLGSTKKVVLVINKIDLVPAAVTQKWIDYLKRELPVVAFKASTQGQKDHLSSSKTAPKNITDRELSHTKLAVGTENLLSILKNYSRNYEKNKIPIAVGVVGYPNVGKSSIINSLKRKKIASISPMPGHTKELQEIALDKKLKLVDSPGVLFEKRSNYTSLVLKNSVRVEKLKNPEDFVAQILKKCPTENLSEIYQIPLFKNANEFLYHVANRKGLLGKGGKINQSATARAVIRDWNKGKISYYTNPPEHNITDTDEFAIKTKWGEELDITQLLKQSKDDIASCEMRADNEDFQPRNFVPLKKDGDEMEDE